MSLFHEPHIDVTQTAKQLEVISLTLENTSTNKNATVILIAGGAISAKNLLGLIQNGEFATPEGDHVTALAIADSVDLDAVSKYNGVIVPYVQNIAINVISEENQFTQGKTPFVAKKQNRVGQFVESISIKPKFDNDKDTFIASINNQIDSDTILSYTILPGMKVQLDVEFGD